jgi:hypothetical protein
MRASVCTKAGLRGGLAWQVPKVPAYKVYEGVTGIIRNMLLVNISFPCVKYFLQKFSTILAHTLRKVIWHCPRLEKFKEYGF